jgi:hypothetical protein
MILLRRVQFPCDPKGNWQGRVGRRGRPLDSSFCKTGSDGESCIDPDALAVRPVRNFCIAGQVVLIQDG